MSLQRVRGPVAAGFSLIELLVSMVIALVVTVAISSILVKSEGNKRSTTSVNDINQTGAYLAYVLDRSIRNAGSGYSQRASDSFGCVIDAAKDGATILPLPAAASAPFANVALQVRLAPVIIGEGKADTPSQVRGDVLTVIGGTSAAANLPQAVKTGSVSGSTLRVTNTLGYDSDDIVVLADAGVGAGCMVQQVAPASGSASGASGDQLNFTGGAYSRDTGSLVNLTNFGANTVAIQMGSVPANPPLMQLYGVGDNSTLFSYDLLKTTTGDVVPIADGVVEMRALYGVDTTATRNGTLDAWIDPSDTSKGYTAADLTTGDSNARDKLLRIIAVRVGLILRTSLKERDPINAATTLTLFKDTTAPRTRTLIGDELNYRYRTVEFTVPLRNTQYAP